MLSAERYYPSVSLSAATSLFQGRLCDVAPDGAIVTQSGVEDFGKKEAIVRFLNAKR